MTTIPYREALRQSWHLVQQYGIVWLFAIFSSYLFAFHICPSDLILRDKMSSVKQEHAEILDTVRKVEQLQVKLEFAQKKDPFFMERLIREEFHLKRTTPMAEN